MPAIVPAVEDVFAKATEPEMSVTGDVAGAEVPRTNVELRSEALRLSGEGDCGSKTPKNGTGVLLLSDSPMANASF